MADVKISALPAATTPLDGTELAPIVQSGTTKRVTVANLTVGRALTASSLTLTTPLSAANGGTGLTSLGTGIATFLGTPTSANLAAAVTDETGTGALVFGTTPTFTTSALFPAGTVSAPGIAASGDTNTGIYFPAADTIGFVEGGVQAMTLDASARLAINATSTSYRLLASDGSGNYWNGSSAWTGGNPAAIVIRNTATGGYDAVVLGQMTDTGGTSKDAWAIGAVGTSGWTAGNNATQTADMYFAVRNNSGGISERMRISSDGTFRVKGAGTAGSTDAFQVAGGAPASAMLLDASGNLGVGTTSPTTYGNYAFIGGTTAIGNTSNAYLYLYTGTTQRGLFYADSGRVQLEALTSNPLTFWTGGSERARIDSNGNVIINTAAIATNATNGFLYVPTCAGTPTGTPTTYTGRAPIVVDTTNNKLYFYSSGVWRDAGP